jgi:hypothetical protein
MVVYLMTNCQVGGQPVVSSLWHLVVFVTFTAALHVWRSHLLCLQPEGALCCGDELQHVIAFGYETGYNENVIITSI